MTAEIAIMNKSAVALAADSAVTMRGEKIYNSVNKLFMLSKYNPVGIMIYGNAELMNTPWETIIKIYRDSLGRRNFDTLQQFADDFITFINSSNPLLPETVQTEHFKSAIIGFFLFIKNNIDTKVRTIMEGNTIDDTQIEIIVEDEVKKQHERLRSMENLPSISGYQGELETKYDKVINETIADVFENLRIPAVALAQLKELCGLIFIKNFFPHPTSGIVIAGFGEKNIFPSLASYRIEGVVNNRLKYIQEKNTSISYENNATIIPFAQSEMVVAFMEGIDPSYHDYLASYISRLCTDYPESIVDNIEQLKNEDKKNLLMTLKEVGQNIFDEFRKTMEEYRRINHVYPVIEAVAGLPKDELAAMAESLVNLTSFKRRISMDKETVGGPIDVAVISKGDGFIWIKRKHYFEPALNPYFFNNYYKEEAKRGEK